MKRLALRTGLPALLAVGLFSGVVFFHFLPTLGRAVMDQKRLMIRELTESSWNILARYEAEERAGRLSREQAQAAAILQVRSLHYGQEGKDYFWINDLQPRMIVHPYRPDLEGGDLSAFADPHGKLIFVAMVDVVRREGAGYVDYMWQWKDDPARIVPKLSYVKGFAPWGWIIGTGVYTDDVDREVAAVAGRLQAAAVLILAAVTLLLVFLLRTSFQAERGRLLTAAALKISEEKYRSLVESAGESIFMSVGDEGLFANASMLKLVGYSREEFARLDAGRLVRATAAEMESGRRHWRAVADGDRAPIRYEAELVTRGGGVVRVMLSLSRVMLQGRPGCMAVATRLEQPHELDLHAARSSDDLAAANRRLATMAGLMMSHGADALQVSRMLSQNADTAVRKGVELAIAELGPPPSDFDVMLMGSLGRAEVSLLADQDHAIIYPDLDAGAEAAARDYFLRLGTRLSTILDAAGYPYCRGGIMSGEPRCCQSLSGWRRTFAGWIHTLEAEDLLQAKIFFDFRGALRQDGLGQDGLVAALRADLADEIASEPRFLHLLARSVLQYEPPLNAFGGFALEKGEADRATFDVKGVMAQIVDYVRLRALQHGVAATATADRLAALASAGKLRAETAAELAESYRFLMDLRLQHQSRRILDRLEPDNRLEPDALDPATRRTLKSVFADIKALQTMLDHEFRGG
ncbi:MAG: putative nucleotidyltransferase substrate binding domain-containing protein [bacterium]|nr:putative nucleotidyltransferase substrate binding domain-containing protein [bacterium]